MTLLQRRHEIMAQKEKKQEYIFGTAKNYELKRTTHNGKACQGGCVVGDKWYAFTIKEDSTEQYLYCYDLLEQTMTLLHTYTALGHANSLTYNNTDNVFYVATGDANVGVSVIDGTTFDITENLSMEMLDGTRYAPWQIAFDRKRRLLYSLKTSGNGKNLMVHATDGTTIAERELENYVSHTTEQGLETDGDYVYLQFSSPSNAVDVYTVFGKFVKSMATSVPNELEEIGYDWNGNFYCHVFEATGYSRIYALLLRTFGGWADMAYVPLTVGSKRQTNATITVTGLKSVEIASSGSKSYNMYIIGAGYPFSYAFLKDKKCRVSYDLVRVSGSAGSFASNVFTANSETLTSLSERLFQKSVYQATVGTKHVEHEFTWGQGEYIPASNKEGTRVGYALFLYADSGNSFEAQNFKFEAKLI